MVIGQTAVYICLFKQKIYRNILILSAFYDKVDKERNLHMANRNSFKKGTIELLLLSILSVEDCYGYQITQRIKEQSSGNITVTEGALYPILYKLSDQGYISDYKKLAGKRLTRVYYHLEKEGKNHLNTLLEEYFKVQEGVHRILSANHINMPK